MKIILYMAVSADGFIADAQGGVGFLDKYTRLESKGVHDVVEYQDFLKSVDIIFMGKKSYEQVVGFGPWAWPDKKTYVLSESSGVPVCENVFFVAGDVGDIVNKLEVPSDSKVCWLFGGAYCAHLFDAANLIDQLILTRVPDQLGTGIFLDISLDRYDLVRTISCHDGIVQEIYELKNKMY